jgi:excisionase family DNA binding protein
MARPSARRGGAADVTPERLLTARELADVLGLSPATVLDRFEREELPGFRLGARVGSPVRFRWSEIETWLEGGRRGPTLVAGRERS